MSRQTNPGSFSEHAACITKPNTALHSITGTYFLGMAGLGAGQAGNMVVCSMCLDRWHVPGPVKG